MISKMIHVFLSRVVIRRAPEEGQAKDLDFYRSLNRLQEQFPPYVGPGHEKDRSAARQH